MAGGWPQHKVSKPLVGECEENIIVFIYFFLLFFNRETFVKIAFIGKRFWKDLKTKSFSNC